MKSINNQSLNKINIVGKLLDATFGNGKSTDGRIWERASVTVRVEQNVNGQKEVSEIPVSFFAYEFTNAGKPNPAWKNIQDLKMMNTAQNVGIDAAARVRLTGAALQENNFVSRTGQLINGWQIRGSFINEVKVSDTATFNVDIYIMDIHDEMDKEGDTTGRLIVKGGIVQYGGKLDVVEFIAETPDKVEFITRNWEENTTVTVRGWFRVTSEEVEVQSSGWGDDIPETNTRYVRELVIATGDDGPKEEDFSYDPAEIKKAFNDRKAYIEQLQINARQTSPKHGVGSANVAEAASKKYDWE